MIFCIKRAFLIQSAREVFLFYIDLFLINFKKNRDSFLLNEIEAIDKINLNASLEELLVCVLEVINSFNENLKTRYEKFYFESLDCEWGKIK